MYALAALSQSSAAMDRLFAGPGEWLQLTPGMFECSGTEVRLACGRLTELNVTCGVQIRKRIEPWRLAVLLIRPAAGSRVLAGGKRYANGCSIIVSGDELAASILGPASVLWLDADRISLSSERALSAGAIKCVLARSEFDWGRLAARGAALATNMEARQVALAALSPSRARSGTLADENRERLVRTALDLMWASIEEPPTLQEICAAAKCSVRTLIYVFNATFGMSPMKYFKVQRLNVAHRRLQGAGSSSRIFDIAADCGFWHLGHFGVDYKAFFGTTPSMTPRTSGYALAEGVAAL